MSDLRIGPGAAAGILVLLWGLAGGLDQPTDGDERSSASSLDAVTPWAPAVHLLCEVEGPLFLPRPHVSDLWIDLESQRLTPARLDGSDRRASRHLHCLVIKP
jgi:hypothetical protein